jgi:hypothetical protein
MPKWGEYDKVEFAPDVESCWVIYSMKLDSANTYYLNKKLDLSIEETLANAVKGDIYPGAPTVITLSYSDGSETVIRLVDKSQIGTA